MNVIESVSPQQAADKIALQPAVDRPTGRHLLLSLRGCDPSILDNEEALCSLVERAAKQCGAVILNVVSHKFTPVGVTAVALLAESHASLHTYPEIGLAYWDCFTCGLQCRPQDTAAVLIQFLQPTDVTQQLIERS